MAIAPDLGELYLDTLYQPGWVEEFYPNAALGADEPAAIRLGPNYATIDSRGSPDDRGASA